MACHRTDEIANGGENTRVRGLLVVAGNGRKVRGGELGVLDTPVHGKPSTIVKVNGGENGEENVLKGVPDKIYSCEVPSLYGIREKLPDCLECIAETEDRVVMAIKHKTLPFSAVQYHPESILTEWDRLEDFAELRWCSCDTVTLM